MSQDRRGRGTSARVGRGQTTGEAVVMLLERTGAGEPPLKSMRAADPSTRASRL